jgi:hypothetical protein
VGETQNINQEANQFERTSADRSGPSARFRIILKQRRQMMLQHSSAGSGWNHDVIKATKIIEKLTRQVTRGRTIA